MLVSCFLFLTLCKRLQYYHNRVGAVVVEGGVEDMGLNSWSEKAPIYSIVPDGGFSIEEYSLARPFASFFPGIAGPYGIPLWVFYVNRGQAIVSMGIDNKDGAIMEFYPANKAYQMVSKYGFRTFIKYRRQTDFIFYEPFQSGFTARAQAVKQRMVIYPHELEIEEVNKTLSMKITVNYFTLPSEPLPALIRMVSIRNLSTSRSLDLEVLDGLPVILPYGLNQFVVKNMSRTAEAWMQAKHIDNFLGYYKVRVELDDRPEVVKVLQGNFAFSVRYGIRSVKCLPLISDPETIFGSVLDFDYPEQFLEDRNFLYPEEQFLQNKTPCAFSFQRVTIPPSGEIGYIMVVGHTESEKQVKRFANQFLSGPDFVLNKRQENEKIISDLMNEVFTISAFAEFDRYTAQTYLDNLLRGGYPFEIPTLNGRQIFYLYGRKHGDLERDYNNFRLEPSFFSQGNGNYRDMNQNRRLDVIFHPEVEDTNVKLFMNLIQLDGYNPLQINGVKFAWRGTLEELDALLEKFVSNKIAPELKEFINGKEFTPGELVAFIRSRNIKTRGGLDRFFRNLFTYCERIEDATHVEGFWTDHWSYNLDLIESYLSIYPDREYHFFFADKSYTFYDNDHYVVPRDEKLVLTPNGVRQYRSVRVSKEKTNLINSRKEYKNKVRTLFGKGQIYNTTLMVKLVTLLATKVMNLDPFGVGIEMEADKPNWYDSLNGLPGLIGSSSAETIEVLRLARFIKSILERNRSKVSCLAFPEEVFDLISLQKRELLCIEDTMRYWEVEEFLRSEYRKRVFWGISGKEKKIDLEELLSYLQQVIELFSRAVERAKDPKSKLIRTYFYYIAEDYEIVEDKVHVSGNPIVRIKRFKQHVLPLFLEGQVHYLRVLDDDNQVKALYDAVRRSPLFDQELEMYKVCASLRGESLEIGRSAVFTPGWLENESIWLHMEYKYLLELVKKGLDRVIFTDLLKTAVCFQKPSVYGRSVLENSSFIVSSAFPDESQWGRGFVARLTGSTVEWLHIWLILCVGKDLFFLDDANRLCFKFAPYLPEWLFTSEAKKIAGKGTLAGNSFAFRLFSKTLVVYHNPERYNCFLPDVGVVHITVITDQDKRVEVKGDTLVGELAELLRSGKIKEISCRIGKRG